jgi:Flp pilus assembly protein TadG
MGSLIGDERADALVEFALVAPLLFLILFGMLDFGKAFNYWIDETHLAAQGARLAVVNNAAPGKCPNGSTPASLQAYIKCNADTAELRNNSTVCITFPNGTQKTGDPVSVSVTTTYHWIPLIGDVLGAGTTPVSGSATMRLEAGPTLSYSSGCV